MGHSVDLLLSCPFLSFGGLASTTWRVPPGKRRHGEWSDCRCSKGQGEPSIRTSTAPSARYCYSAFAESSSQWPLSLAATTMGVSLSVSPSLRLTPLPLCCASPLQTGFVHIFFGRGLYVRGIQQQRIELALPTVARCLSVAQPAWGGFSLLRQRANRKSKPGVILPSSCAPAFQLTQRQFGFSGPLQRLAARCRRWFRVL